MRALKSTYQRSAEHSVTRKKRKDWRRKEERGSQWSTKTDLFTRESGPEEREKGKGSKSGLREKSMRAGGRGGSLTEEDASSISMETCTKGSGRREQLRGEEYSGTTEEDSMKECGGISSLMVMERNGLEKD